MEKTNCSFYFGVKILIDHNSGFSHEIMFSISVKEVLMPKMKENYLVIVV